MIEINQGPYLTAPLYETILLHIGQYHDVNHLDDLDHYLPI